jgi:outer membrane protein OmpU
MKKVLFATTALIATAGMAAAEVRLSGYGRFGLDWNEANETVVGRSETNITSRLRIQFDMSAETDSGVVFNARTRAQIESRDGTPGGGAFNGARFGVSYGGLTMNVGNIIGAIENTPGAYLETRTAGVGIDGAGFQSHVLNTGGGSFGWDAYSSAGVGSNGIEVLYSAGGFTGHISYSQANGGTVPGSANGLQRTAVMGAYTFGDWTAAIGYQDSNAVADDKLIFTIAGDIGQFGVRFAYGNSADSNTVDGSDIDKFGIYGNMDIGAASNILAFVTSEDAPGMVSDGTGYGIHYSYDLGGGASFEAGWTENSSDLQTLQAGVYFSF